MTGPDISNLRFDPGDEDLDLDINLGEGRAVRTATDGSMHVVRTDAPGDAPFDWDSYLDYAGEHGMEGPAGP